MGYSGVPAALTEGLFVDNKTEWAIINKTTKDGFKKWVQGHLYGFYDRLALLNPNIIDPEAASSEPSWTISPTSASLDCEMGKTATVTIKITGTNLTEAPSFTLDDTIGLYSVTESSLKKSNSTITVNFAPTTVGSYTAKLKLTSGDLTKTIKLNGTAMPSLRRPWRYDDHAEYDQSANWGWDVSKVSAIAYNEGKLYMIYGDNSSIKVINAQNGSQLGDLNITGVEGGSEILSDIKFCDGKLVATNRATTANNDSFKMYVWDNDNSAPRVILQTTDFGGSDRIGDCIGFSGSWTSGKFVFGRYNFDEKKTYIIEYPVIDGIVYTSATTIMATYTTSDNSETETTHAIKAGKYTRVYPTPMATLSMAAISRLQGSTPMVSARRSFPPMRPGATHLNVSLGMA